MSKLAFLYSRVSTDEQNIMQQQKLLVDYAKREGYVYRSFSDHGISGTLNPKEREGWSKLIAHANVAHPDIILVQSPDRITRSLEHSLELWKHLQKTGIKVVTLYEGVFDPQDGDHYFVFMLKCLLSEREVMLNRRRSRIGIARAKAEGKYKGGKKGRKWKNGEK